MSLKERRLNAAKEVTGGPSIPDVAEFQPKGTMGAATAGRAAVGLARDIPPSIAVAVSPSTVYLLGMRSVLSVKHLDLIVQIDREKLGVEVHQRASVRTVVLEDLDTEMEFALEVPRLNLYHGKAMVELLMLSDQHHDDEQADPEEA